MKIMAFLLLFVVISGVLYAFAEGVPRSVYGPLLSSEDLNSYFERNFGKYKELNFLNSDILSGYLYDLPYVAKGSGSLLSKWHIEDWGRIPRWSGWSKELDKVQRHLIQEHRSSLVTSQKEPREKYQ